MNDKSPPTTHPPILFRAKHILFRAKHKQSRTGPYYAQKQLSQHRNCRELMLVYGKTLSTQVTLHIEKTPRTLISQNHPAKPLSFKTDPKLSPNLENMHREALRHDEK